MTNLLNQKKRTWRSDVNKEIIIVTIINLLIGIIALITKNKNAKETFSICNYIFFLLIMYLPVASFFKNFCSKSRYIHILPLSKMQIFLLNIRDWFCLLAIFIFSNLIIRFLILETSIDFILKSIDTINLIPIFIYKLISVLLMAGIIISLGIIFKIYKKYWTIATVVFIGLSNLILNSFFRNSEIVFKFWTNLKLEDLVVFGNIVTIATTYIQETIPLSYILTAIIQVMIIIFAFSKLNKISIE